MLGTPTLRCGAMPSDERVPAGGGAAVPDEAIALPVTAEETVSRPSGPTGRATAWAVNRRAVVVAAVGTVALRVVTEWIGLVSQYGVNFPHEVAKRPSLLSEVWGHWDAGFYLSIAQYGYAGRVPGHGQVAHGIAFAPLYPWGIRFVHAVTPFNWTASAELLSTVALFVALVALHRLAASFGGDAEGSAAAMLLLAFPTAFFLLAPYPESLALALVALALLCARNDRWMLAGLFAAGATLTKYYLVVLAVALCVAALDTWLRDRRGPPPWSRLAKVTGPAAVALVGWMVFQEIHLGSPVAFATAQSAQWHRHVGAPWTLAVRTGSDLVHWRFLDTSTASVTELFDVVTIVLLVAAAVYAYRRVSRASGVLLGLGLCIFTFQTYLQSVTREVLVFAPLFVVLGAWTVKRRWLERLLLALFIPCGYYLIQRFVSGAFAG